MKFSLWRYIPYTVLAALCMLSCTPNGELSTEDKNWLKEQDSIVIGLFPDYAPYQFRNKNGFMDGIFVDYIDLLEEKMHHAFKHVEYDNWTKLLADSEAGKIDIILEIQPTEDRLKYLNFYDLNVESPEALVIRISDNTVKDLSDLKGKTLVLPVNYAINEAIKAKYPEIKIVELPTELQCLEALNRGSYDAYVGPRAVVKNHIRVNRLKNIDVVANTSYSYRPNIAVLKSRTKLNAIFAKTKSSVSEEEWKKLESRWLYSEVKPLYQQYTYWFKIAMFGVLGLLIFFFSNLYLKHRVRQSTNDLNNAKEQAEESDMLKTQFIQNISHEIRTPMNSMLGFSKLLGQSETEAQEAKTYTTSISKSMGYLVDVVDTIIEVSHLQAKKVSISLDTICINDFLEEIRINHASKAATKNVSLLFLRKRAYDNLNIRIDSEKLGTIIGNLIDNAIKFTDQGTVVLNCKISDEQCTITISDTGIGFTQDDHDMIFKSFSQLQREVSKKYKGLGLGLTLVRENVLLMGGTIRFSSKIKEGSEFTIILPLEPIESV